MKLENPEIQIFEIQPEDIGVLIMKVDGPKQYKCFWILGGADGATSMLENPYSFVMKHEGYNTCLVNSLEEASEFVAKSFKEWHDKYEKELQSGCKLIQSIKKYLDNDHFILPFGDTKCTDLEVIQKLCNYLEYDLLIKSNGTILIKDNDEVWFENPTNDTIAEIILLQVEYDLNDEITDAVSFNELCSKVHQFLN